MLLEKKVFTDFANRLFPTVAHEEGKKPIVKQTINPDLKKRIKKLRNNVHA
jgi:hypothetical protein